MTPESGISFERVDIPSRIDETREYMSKRGFPVISMFAAALLAMLCELQHGMHHVEGEMIHRRWFNPKQKDANQKWLDRHTITADCSTYMATMDCDTLTRLVFLCHDYNIRLEIHCGSPSTLQLHFLQPSSSTTMPAKHPTLEQAVSKHRLNHELKQGGVL